jgi:UPF0755 protein
VALSALSVAGGAAFFLPGPAARRGAATTIILEPGLGVRGITHRLGAAGVIRSPLVFFVAAEISGAAPRLKAGEYAFASRASVGSVLWAMRNGMVVRHYVTIPEGLTSRQAVAVLDHSDVLTGAAAAPPEGSLLPETYQVRRGESREHVLGRMRQARDKLVTRLWTTRAAGLPYQSPEEAVTMASIIEKETAIAAERPRIARVFLNRLGGGMRLASDPTVAYGLNGGEPLGHGLRVSELAKATPYNTYLNSGLPPTPIDNPGRAALAAALHPDPGSELYFVADGSGGHVFSTSLAEHLKNVARWRTLERGGLGQ